MPLDNFPTQASDGSRIPNCSLPLQEGIKTNSLIFSSDSGHDQRRKKGANKRTWELNFPVLTQLQADAIFSFYLNHTTTVPFIWTHPVEKIAGTQTKKPFTVTFSNDMLQKDYFAHGVLGPLYKMSMKIEEVL
jgi:phage-related protein